MPKASFRCKQCQNVMKKFFSNKVPSEVPCTVDACDGQAERLLGSPTSVSKISVDNGVQAKAVEILPNILELNDERDRDSSKRKL